MPEQQSPLTWHCTLWEPQAHRLELQLPVQHCTPRLHAWSVVLQVHALAVHIVEQQLLFALQEIPWLLQAHTPPTQL
jgi:hypothetical protein